MSQNFNAVTAPAGTSFKGDLATDGSLVQGTELFVQNSTGVPVPVGLGVAASTASLPVAIASDQIGAGGTGIAQPTGGVGLLGWLSGIYSALIGTLKAKLAGANPTDRSGTITAAGTAQAWAPANASRFGYSFYNQHASAIMWVNDVGGTALAGGSSFPVGPGALYETPSGCAPTSALSIFCATAGAAFTAKEF